MSLGLGLRKIVLLASIAFLTLILVLQQFVFAPVNSREYTVKETVDRIEIKKPNESMVTFVRSGETWRIEELSEMAQTYAVDSISSAFSSLTSLSVVSGGMDLERYSLTEDQRIIVTLYSQSKKVRTVHVGKTSLSGSQTYVQLDEKNDVLLASVNLRDMVVKGAADFVQKPQEPASGDVSGAVAPLGGAVAPLSGPVAQ